MLKFLAAGLLAGVMIRHKVSQLHIAYLKRRLDRLYAELDYERLRLAVVEHSYSEALDVPPFVRTTPADSRTIPQRRCANLRDTEVGPQV